MSRELSLKIVLLQAALAIAVAAPALVYAEKDPPAIPSTTKDGSEPRNEPSAVPSTAKDAPPPGTDQSENIDNPIEVAKTRFEAFNGVDMIIGGDGAIVIQDLKEKTAAARSGLMKGDAIVEIDGQPLKTRGGTESLLEQTSAQPYHIVKLIREGEKREVVLGRHLELLGMLVVPDAGSRPLVRRVATESPAEKAGVHIDDIITGVGGRKTETFKQFNDFVVPLVRKMPSGQELNLRLMRDTEEIEVTAIRPEKVKLPLVAAPEKPLPGDGRANPRRSPRQMQQAVEADDIYLKEFAALTTPYEETPGTPFVGFDAGSTGEFPIVPTVNAVAAVLHSTSGFVESPSTEATSETIPIRNPKGPRVVPNDAPAGIPVPSISGVVEDPTQPLQGVPVTRVELLQRQRAMQAAREQAKSVVTERVPAAAPVLIPTIKRNGFVVVASDAGVPFVKARVTGLAPGRSYSLVVHQYGDFGDVLQNSAGSIVAVLATFQAGADGRAEITHTLNQAVLPSALMGRVISVLPATFDPTTNSFSVPTNSTSPPPQTTTLAQEAPASVAFGVFGLASPGRFRR